MNKITSIIVSTLITLFGMSAYADTYTSFSISLGGYYPYSYYPYYPANCLWINGIPICTSLYAYPVYYTYPAVYYAPRSYYPYYYSPVGFFAGMAFSAFYFNNYYNYGHYYNNYRYWPNNYWQGYHGWQNQNWKHWHSNQWKNINNNKFLKTSPRYLEKKFNVNKKGLSGIPHKYRYRDRVENYPHSQGYKKMKAGDFRYQNKMKARYDMDPRFHAPKVQSKQIHGGKGKGHGGGGGGGRKHH